MEKLLKEKIVHHTRYGLTDNRGNIIGFHRTRTKVYIEDRYADLAAKLTQNEEKVYDKRSRRPRY